MKNVLFIMIFIFGLQAGTFKNNKKACEEGKAESCKNLGYYYQTGQNVNKNYVKARMYYSKACELNNSEGCRMLGDLYYYGQGVDKNDSKAKHYYERSCQLHNKEGCKSLQSDNDALKEELERMKQEREHLMLEVEVLDKI